MYFETPNRILKTGHCFFSKQNIRIPYHTTTRISTASTAPSFFTFQRYVPANVNKILHCSFTTCTGDDSEQVAMLGKLRETSETKTKLDHFEKKIKNLTRQVQLQETKVDLLKRKHNEQGKRTLIFLEENELWRRKQAVVTAETDFQSLMESNDRVWLDVLGDRRNEVKNARKLRRFVYCRLCETGSPQAQSKGEI